MQGKIGRAEFFSLALVLCLNSVVLLGAVEKTAGPLSWLVLVAALPTGLLCWLLLIPTIKAIAATIRFNKTQLAVTNKRIIGKVGVFNTKTLDAPLNKIQNTSSESKFFGKIFNFGTIKINTAAGAYDFYGIKNVEAFKGVIMSQIEEYEEQRMRDQASQMASAMASVINK